MPVATAEQTQQTQAQPSWLERVQTALRIRFHQMRLKETVHELELYRWHRRWLQRQHKLLIVSKQRLDALPRSTRAERHRYEQAKHQQEKLAKQMSPFHLAGDHHYANSKTARLAKLRDKHATALATLNR